MYLYYYFSQRRVLRVDGEEKTELFTFGSLRKSGFISLALASWFIRESREGKFRNFSFTRARLPFNFANIPKSFNLMTLLLKFLISSFSSLDLSFAMEILNFLKSLTLLRTSLTHLSAINLIKIGRLPLTLPRRNESTIAMSGTYNSTSQKNFEYWV